MKISFSISFICGFILLLLAGWKPFDALSDQKGNRTSDSNTGLQFIENKGQWNGSIRFIADLSAGKMYLEKNAFSYFLYKDEDLIKMHNHGGTRIDSLPEIIRSHIFRVNFLGASTESWSGARPFEEYRNYYIGNDRSRWATRVMAFREVTYHNIYPFTDMSTYGDHFELKYEFVIKPGGSPDRIRMHYSGADELYVKEGNLHIKTSVNLIMEQKPYSYQIIEGVKKEVPCNFLVEDDKVSFQFPKGFDPAVALVIDPKLIFSTFSGSLADNWGFTATFDNDGQVYSGGIVFGPNWQNIPGDTGFLPTPGAYQDTFAGGTFYPCDMGIIKYTPTGTSRIYATYLGGSLNEAPHSLVVTGSGDLLILGTTGSANFPTTISAYDSTFNGGSSITSSSSIQYVNGSDIVVAKLSADGTALVASTYIGGTGNDGLNTSVLTRYNYGDDFRGEIIVDGSGNCYVATTTASNNFPVVNGFQPTFGGGFQDGCVFKMNAGLTSLIWSSYLGGSDADAAYAVQFDQSFDVYVCGGTASDNFPITGGALFTSRQGGVDGYVVHISGNGSNLVNSSFIGTPLYDQAYFVQLDSSGNVYLLGQTMGNYPVVPDSTVGTIYSNPGGNQFIHKLNNTLNGTVFSTVYGTGGGIPNISPSAFLVNNCENIFVSGWGGNTGGQQGSTTGLPVTSNAYQLTTDGDDFHLLVLFKDAVSLLYATFFGGPVSNEHVDGGTSRFDKNGIVYQSVCGGCGGLSDFPTTPGVWSNTNNSPNCNNAVFKFDMSDINAAFNTIPNDEGCVPFSANFINVSTGGISYYWDFGDSTFSNLFNGAHTYTDTGTYNVILVITDSTTCQVKDSAYATIKVHPLPIPETSPDTSVCPGGSANLTANGGVSYIWSSSSNLSCNLCQTTTATPDSNSSYYVNITDSNGCQATDTVNLSILPAPVAVAGFDIIICPGNSVVLNASGGVSYSWSPDSTLLNPNLANPTAFPTITTNYIVTVTDQNGCVDSDSLLATVQDSLIADAGPDLQICSGDTAWLFASGGANYSWSPGTGLNDPLIQNPTAFITATMTYSVAVSSGSCSDVDSVSVIVTPLPVASAGPDQTICQGNSANLTATGSWFYLWNSGDTTAGITVVPDSASTYSVLVFDSLGCSDSDQVTVNVKQSPVAFAGNDTLICKGETVILNASGGTTYIWNTGKPGPTDAVTPDSSTVYWVTAFDTIGCSDQDTVEVVVIPGPQAVIGIASDGGCEPFTVQFINNSVPADSSLTYLWDFGDPASGPGNTDTIASPLHTYQYGGTYTATLVLSYQICSGLQAMTANITINVNTIPTGGLIIYPEEVSIFNPQVSFMDNSSGALNCILVFPNGDTLIPCSNTYSFNDTGLLEVKQIVFNGLGCSDTVTATVYVNPEFIFFTPNSFSPNGDGINDVFMGKGLGIKNYEMYVFDRWGDQIFMSDELNKGWDGKANGGKFAAQQDVYVYLVKLTDFKDFPHKYIGRVTLLR